VNVYSVKLAKPVPSESSPHFGNATMWLYVVASSFAAAHDTVMAAHPAVEIRGIDLMNYKGLPILIEGKASAEAKG
jgi:hypothetical protein